MATPAPPADPAAPTSATSSYTGIVVTTPGIQIIPEATSAPDASTNGSSEFPTAAIAIIAIVVGLAFLFIAYKSYVWWFRRYARRGEVPLPETRPLASSGMATSPMMGSGPSLMSLAYVDGRRSNSALGFPTMPREREDSWGADSMGEKDWSPNGSASGLTSPSGGMGTAASRGSLASSAGTGHPRRSYYGLHAAVNGPQLRPQASSTRLNGAPHAPHSRIDIVPPSPLAPHPGTIVAVDKATLEFAPSSGVQRGEAGGSLGLGPAFDHVSGNGSSFATAHGVDYPSHAFPPPSSHRGRSSPGARASSSTHSSPHRHRLYQHGSHSHSPSTTSSSTNPSPSSSSAALRSLQGPSAPTFVNPGGRPLPPPINTDFGPAPSGPVAGSTVSSVNMPTSPLDRLQQRMAAEAKRADAREMKARERSDRVRRANEGDDGTWDESAVSVAEQQR